MKWIRKKGTLKVSETLTLEYGDDIPKKGISSASMKKFKELGYIGDIIENIAEHPEVRALKEQIRRRDDKVEALEKSVEKLKAKIEELNVQIEEMGKPPIELDKDGNPIIPEGGDK